MLTKNILARALKFIFTIFCFFFLLSTSNNPGISSFHKSNYTCLCYFYHLCSIQCWLIGQFLKVSKFDWFLWIHVAHSENLLTACANQLIYNHHLLFFFLLSTSNNPGISSFHKSNYTCLCYFYHLCSIQCWLIGQFLKVSKFDWFLWIHVAHSENLLTACANQLIYNLSLIKLCSACVKQSTAVNIAINACLLLAN